MTDQNLNLKTHFYRHDGKSGLIGSHFYRRTGKSGLVVPKVEMDCLISLWITNMQE